MSPEALQLRLSKLDSLDALRTLLADLSYEFSQDDAPLLGSAKVDAAAREVCLRDPQVIARSGDFAVIYTPLKNWDNPVSAERLIISRLQPSHGFALWIFSDEKAQRWHLVNVKRGGREVERSQGIEKRHVLRRISISQGRRPGRTICERLARLDVQSISPTLGVSGLQIQAVHDGAFDVESVTNAFYKGYRIVLGVLQRHLKSETKAAADAQWAHAQALQTLNRLMFLRFLEHKETRGVHWLGDDPDFTLSLWKSYKASQSKPGSKPNRFHEDWLAPLFFHAFNNSFSSHDHPLLPQNVREAMERAPYLNGGLFKRNELDAKYLHAIPDSFFELLFDKFAGQEPGFFERYNFTISEDSPFDQEVAVDPEMIGHVYESLINLSEIEGEETEAAVLDARGDHGIFYTQRVEIDLMGRLSLCDYFHNHLSKDFERADLRDLLLEWLFAYDDSEKKAADARVGEASLWEPIDALLRRLSICDPACGSGAFLVGMLAIVDDLQARANAVLGHVETPYDRCRRIIQDALYGVDVMEWAVHVAELRLWLHLLIENDTAPGELNNHYPLLPNLSFKVRCGDSLVQELGGVTLGLGSQVQVSPELRRELDKLKAMKRKYFQAQGGTGIKLSEIEHEEKKFFTGMLGQRRDSIRARLIEIAKERVLPNLLGALPDAKKQKAWDKEEEQAHVDLNRIEAANIELGKMTRPPFVWDLSFPEVFLRDKKAERGFDVVIGNPPYVSQQKIGPPQVLVASATERKSYKDALQRSVQGAWPQFFAGGKRKLDGKSDLYLYFYLHGLKLLNPDGAFAFITSNSWLDAGYGAELQEFLLRFGRVRVIFDNEVQRSFKTADVNTAIAILGAGGKDEKANAKEIARFIMWRVPFEEASSALLWQAIENAPERLVRSEFRLRPFSQAALLAEGANPENVADYTGNKWGGKYLRAPDIYDVVMKKGAKVLSRTGALFSVETYLNTGGADDFFFVGVEESRGSKVVIRNRRFNETFEVEAELCVPFIESPTQLKHVNVQKDQLPTSLLAIPRGYDISKKGVARYIKWGEKHKFSEASGRRGSLLWYVLPQQAYSGSNLIWPCRQNNKHYVAVNPGKTISHRFYRLDAKSKQDFWLSGALLNSTITAMFVEMHTAAGLGQGVLDINGETIKKIPTLLPNVCADQKNLIQVFKQIADRPLLSIVNEVRQPDRQALDAVIFDALKLSPGERDAVYEAVVNLVSKRLQKAGSLRERA